MSSLEFRPVFASLSKELRLQLVGTPYVRRGTYVGCKDLQFTKQGMLYDDAASGFTDKPISGGYVNWSPIQSIWVNKGPNDRVTREYSQTST
jgi:hypothetical protein